MVKIVQLILISLLSFSYISFAQSPEKISPVGFWKTIDDVTGQPKSIVQIWKGPNNLLFGKVVTLFQEPDRLCTACTGANHNKPIVGMTVLGNLKKNIENSNEWINGEIIDPKNGKTYHCNIQLTDNNQKLHVRGFIGVPLFGRSQTWIKA